MEFCDIFYDKKEFIHIKRFRGSSALSHLFMQGQNPATALVFEGKSFVKEANTVINKLNSGWVLPETISPSEYTIVYAIASSEKGRDLKEILPFFSKVSLTRVFKTLRSYQFNVAVKKIIVDDEVIKQKESKINSDKKQKRRIKGKHG
jgi:uncharacterized protein (TIGR04141 family)